MATQQSDLAGGCTLLMLSKLHITRQWSNGRSCHGAIHAGLSLDLYDVSKEKGRKLGTASTGAVLQAD